MKHTMSMQYYCTDRIHGLTVVILLSLFLLLDSSVAFSSQRSSRQSQSKSIGNIQPRLSSSSLILAKSSENEKRSLWRRIFGRTGNTADPIKVIEIKDDPEEAVLNRSGETSESEDVTSSSTKSKKDRNDSKEKEKDSTASNDEEDKVKVKVLSDINATTNARVVGNENEAQPLPNVAWIDDDTEALPSNVSLSSNAIEILPTTKVEPETVESKGPIVETKDHESEPGDITEANDIAEAEGKEKSMELSAAQNTDSSSSEEKSRLSSKKVTKKNTSSDNTNDSDKVSKSPKKRKGFIGQAVQLLVLGFVVAFVAPFVSEELWEGNVNFMAREKILPRTEPNGLPFDTPYKEVKPEIKVEDLDSKVSESLPTTDTEESLPVEKRRQMILSFVSDAVNTVGPSVIRIDTETHMIAGDDGGIPSPPNSGLVQQGQGSGLIFSSDGLIMTNAHVVEDATKVTVTLTDGRMYQAKVLGQGTNNVAIAVADVRVEVVISRSRLPNLRNADEIVDIAVIKILPESREGISTIPELPVAKLGDSDKLDVGQIVIAVGSPGGLDNTVTMGIISGLERSSTMVGIPHKKVDYIQTDAAINPGNRYVNYRCSNPSLLFKRPTSYAL